mmetsp:Transcript_36836/g.42847  ORF Transcript_36836/g.42847 Transcript_36836/m.42847 type:complete len:215 (-) Transcript_36836:332-976(-)
MAPFLLATLFRMVLLDKLICWNLRLLGFLTRLSISLNKMGSVSFEEASKLDKRKWDIASAAASSCDNDGVVDVALLLLKVVIVEAIAAESSSSMGAGPRDEVEAAAVLLFGRDNGTAAGLAAEVAATAANVAAAAAEEAAAAAAEVEEAAARVAAEAAASEGKFNVSNTPPLQSPSSPINAVNLVLFHCSLPTMLRMNTIVPPVQIKAGKSSME